MVLRALMVAGSKSFTHMLLALERFDNLLTTLLAETGERVRAESMAGNSFASTASWIPLHHGSKNRGPAPASSCISNDMQRLHPPRRPFS